MSWKDKIIVKAEKIKNISKRREYLINSCLDNCNIKDYNYHCQRCKLYKYLNKVVKLSK